MKTNILLKRLIPESILLFWAEHRYWLSQQFLNHTNRFYEMYRKMGKDNLAINDVDIWIQKLKRYCFAQKERGYQLGSDFFEARITIVKPIDISKDDIIVLCPQKDDFTRIKVFVEYHRKIGVKKFVILDNDSTDGSFEWLKEQADVFLLQTKDEYTTIRREAWINRMFAYFGYNRWYIVLDSDELLTYDGCENITISDLIYHYSYHGIKRGLALLLDMYAKPEFYIEGKNDDYLWDCRLFDVDTYNIKYGSYVNIIEGGPRNRVMGTSSFVFKYPVLYIDANDLQCSSHYLFPYKKNKQANCQIVIRHYKFLAGDLERYKQRQIKGNFSSGSYEYKKYVQVLEGERDINFIYEGSCEYIQSSSLRNIKDVYKYIDWNDVNDKNA